MAFPSLLSDHEQRAFSEFLNQLAQEDSAKPPTDGRGSPLDAATLQQQQQQLQLQLQHHLHLRQLQMQHQQHQQQQQPQFSGHGTTAPGTTLPPPFAPAGTPEMDQQHQGIAQQHREWIQMLSSNPILAPGGVIDPHAMSQAFLANPGLMAQANAITQAMVLAQQQQMQMQMQRQQQQQQQQQQHLHAHHQPLSHAHHHPIPHHNQLPVPPHLLSQQPQQASQHLSMPHPSHHDQQQYHHGEQTPNANSVGHMSPPGMPSHSTIPSQNASPGMSFSAADQDPAMSDSSTASAAAKNKPSPSSSSTIAGKRKSKSGSTTNGRSGTNEPAGPSMGSPSTPPPSVYSEQFNNQSQEHREEETAQHRHMKSSIRKGSSASVSDRANGGDYLTAEESGGGGSSLKRKGSLASGPASAASAQEENEDELPASLSGGADTNGSTGMASTATTTTVKGAKEITAKGGRPGQSTPRAKKPHHELLTEAEKKANHIASEQKRRQNIRIGFDSLVEIVPTLSDCHRSEALILQKSVDYIQRLLQQKRELKEHVRDLQRHLGDSIDDDDSSTEMEVEEHMRP